LAWKRRQPASWPKLTFWNLPQKPEGVHSIEASQAS
jgi:hypothetical protein